MGWFGTRRKTFRRPYSATRNPSRFSRASEVCSKTRLQPVAHSAEIRPRSVRGERALADDEDFVTGEVRTGLHCLALDIHPREQPVCLSLGIEDGDLARHRRRRRARHHVDRKGVFLRLARGELGLQGQRVESRLPLGW